MARVFLDYRVYEEPDKLLGVMGCTYRPIVGEVWSLYPTSKDNLWAYDFHVTRVDYDTFQVYGVKVSSSSPPPSQQPERTPPSPSAG